MQFRRKCSGRRRQGTTPSSVSRYSAAASARTLTWSAGFRLPYTYVQRPAPRSATVQPREQLERHGTGTIRMPFGRRFANLDASAAPGRSASGSAWDSARAAGLRQVVQTSNSISDGNGCLQGGGAWLQHACRSRPGRWLSQTRSVRPAPPGRRARYPGRPRRRRGPGSDLRRCRPPRRPAAPHRRRWRIGRARTL